MGELLSTQGRQLLIKKEEKRYEILFDQIAKLKIKEGYEPESRGTVYPSLGTVNILSGLLIMTSDDGAEAVGGGLLSFGLVYE